MIPINDLSIGYNLYREEYEKKALDILRSGWYILGKEVEGFEIEFSEALSEDCYCAGVDNGLDAIVLGLQACGIGAGDEVIVQANGYIATILGVLQCGTVPVFVEPDDYYQMDANAIEPAITDKTRAVLVTHLYGMATRMDAILDICNKNGLMLFEDCAQSHFAPYNGKNTGTFGKASFFSFYPTKNLGGFGDGGCVVSCDKSVTDRVKVLRNYGSDRRYHNIAIGYNARLDELQAGLLRVKLSHIKELIGNRQHIADRYLEEISNPLVELPKVASGCIHTWYQFVVRVDKRDAFREHLRCNGVATDIAWETPPYLQPALAEKFDYRRGMYPKTEHLCEVIVSLPMMDHMEEEEITKVVEAVNSFSI